MTGRRGWRWWYNLSRLTAILNRWQHRLLKKFFSFGIKGEKKKNFPIIIVFFFVYRFGKRNYGGLDERLMVRNSYQFLSVQAKQFDNDNKLITESGRGTV